MTLSGGGLGNAFDGPVIVPCLYRGSTGHRGGVRVRCIHDHGHSCLETRFLSNFLETCNGMLTIVVITRS